MENDLLTREKYKRPDEAQRAAVTLALQHGAEIDYTYQERFDHG